MILSEQIDLMEINDEVRNHMFDVGNVIRQQ